MRPIVLIVAWMTAPFLMHASARADYPSRVTFYRTTPPFYAVPWSYDPELRRMQAIDRQIATLDYTRWYAEAFWYGEPGIWGPQYYGSIQQPVGHRIIYNGRGGYAYEPVYAGQVGPPLRLSLPLPVVESNPPPLKQKRFSW